MLVVFLLNEYLFLGRALSIFKSAFALVGIVVGVVFYVNLDIFFMVIVYVFCVFFIVVVVLEGLIVKYMIDKILFNNWSRLFNINVLSILFVVVLFVFFGESMVFMDIILMLKVFGVLIVMCFMGLGMSFLMMWIRETFFAILVFVVATCNKFIFEFVNWMIWDKYMIIEGMYVILVIMMCGIFYE